MKRTYFDRKDYLVEISQKTWYNVLRLLLYDPELRLLFFGILKACIGADENK